MTSRRNRSLANRDIELWLSVSRLVTPLAKRGSRSIETRAHSGSDVTGEQDRLNVPNYSFSMDSWKPEIPSVSKLPAFSPKEHRRLRRGQLTIQARIDLHGFYESDAHRALTSFIENSYARGLTYVLVVTGKGKTTSDGHELGILRRNVPHWLRSAALSKVVLSFEMAGSHHGGSGALYVRLRRH